TAGSVYVFHGNGARVITSPATVLAGRSAGDYFGASVAGVGDVNGDGYDDVVEGSSSRTMLTTWGMASVYRGGPSGLAHDAAATLSYTSPAPMATWGTQHAEVAGPGDVDGDGLDDVLLLMQ